MAQLQVIQCTVNQSDSTPVIDRVQSCLPESEFQEIKNCIQNFATVSPPVKKLQKRLNLLIIPTEQQPIEVIAQNQPNGKAKNGLLQELCHNYFQLDDQTLGCKVTKPKVQIFYETQSSLVSPVFDHMSDVAPFAPFETLAQFEFIPYGNTKLVDANYICVEGEDQCTSNWIHVSVSPLF